MTANPPNSWHSLKYAQDLAKAINFPPPSLLPRGCEGFRFVHSDLNDGRNFLPVAFIPPRSLAPTPAKPQASLYALSLFDTLDNLQTRARSACKTSPMFLKRVGTHFAKMVLSPTDGAATAPGNGGHFDFYEHLNFVALNAVAEHKELAL